MRLFPPVFPRSPWLLIGILSIVSSPAPVLAAPSGNAELLVEKTVLLMRHGVRSGTSTDGIALHSDRSWPDFGIADGQLTAHGRTALLLWGQFHRRQLARQGQLPASGKLIANQVEVLASPLQRTRDSAEAFLDGLAPGSAIPVSHAHTRAWFIPPFGGLRNVDPVEVRRTVVEALGMSLDEAQKHYQPAIQALENTLGVPDARLSSKPWQIYLDDDNLHITPLQEIEDMTETIRMQYADGLPLTEVGFGSGSNQTAIAGLMAPHALLFDVTRHPRMLSVQHGANLFDAVSKSLAADTNDEASTKVAVSVFMGHDVNLAALAKILGFHWQLPEHARDDINPGATLKFERVCDRRDGKRYARISYISPTLDQLRELSPFGDESPPFVRVFEPGAASSPLDGNLIPLEQFAALAAEAVHEAGPENLYEELFPARTSFPY